MIFKGKTSFSRLKTSTTFSSIFSHWNEILNISFRLKVTRMLCGLRHIGNNYIWLREVPPLPPPIKTRSRYPVNFDLSPMFVQVCHQFNLALILRTLLIGDPRREQNKLTRERTREKYQRESITNESKKNNNGTIVLQTSRHE